ncbi:MAG: asparagine synthase (glutamine-hydrolyzing), partial [Chitinophagaceae bacterium]
ILKSMTDVIAYRGPDDQGQYVKDFQHSIIGLGHRRLSILDLSPLGHQPYFFKNLSLVFNGEVYNFKEIREKLIKRGYSFLSNSDTEVIIKAYQQYGIDSVNKFIGMFAYAIYDMKKQQLFLLRDRAGVKPLHYYYKNDCLLFASELKSIYSYPVFEKNINEQAVTLFFKYGYIRAPHTIFKNTFKIQPGHYIKIDLGRKAVTDHKYWDVIDHYNKPKLKISEQEALEEVENLFTSAFQYRMVSDVPVGVFLSGGYDSSVVTAILQKNSTQKIKTFTIGFDVKKWDEAPFAKQIAAHPGTDHHEYYCTTKEAQDIFTKLPELYDEPFGDSSAIPTTLVSQFARKQVTVSLSADGGDEVFAGYTKYNNQTKINNYLERSPGALLSLTKNVLNTSTRLYPGLKKSHKIERVSEILNTYKKSGLADVYDRQFIYRDLVDLLPGYDEGIGLYDDIGIVNNENDYMNIMLARDYRSYMVDDVLTKVDRATMSVALEGREPLLDHRIIEFVSQLPSDLKYNNESSKYLLKKITHKYVPKEMLDRPKAGFTFPMYEWLTTDLKDHLFYYINESQFSKHDFLNPKRAIKIREEFLGGTKGRKTPIWLLLMFQMWWNKWM